MQAMRHIPMTMADWEKRLNGFLKLWDHEVLKDNGKISAEMAKLHAETEFEWLDTRSPEEDRYIKQIKRDKENQ